MSTPQIMEPSACTWCGIAERGHARQYADAVGWHTWAQPSQEQMLARMKARRLQLAVARAGALPVPTGGERTPDVVEEELTGVNLVLWRGIEAYARLRLALTAAKRDRSRLRARVAELEAERHSTNEALSDAAEALRAGQGDGCSCPPADHPHQVGCPLDLPAPGSSERPVNELTSVYMPVASLREDVSPQVKKLRNLLAGQRASLEDPHDSPLAHPYRLSHDLPELGGA